MGQPGSKRPLETGSWDEGRIQSKRGQQRAQSREAGEKEGRAQTSCKVKLGAHQGLGESMGQGGKGRSERRGRDKERQGAGEGDVGGGVWAPHSRRSVFSSRRRLPMLPPADERRCSAREPRAPPCSTLSTQTPKSDQKTGAPPSPSIFFPLRHSPPFPNTALDSAVDPSAPRGAAARCVCAVLVPNRRLGALTLALAQRCPSRRGSSGKGAAAAPKKGARVVGTGDRWSTLCHITHTEML